jgi:nitrite reductase/ring-hydroxylating ferredoxin subunit
MSDHSVPSDPLPAATRRSVLHAIGLAVLTGGTASVVGGCSADGGSGTPASSEPSVPGASAPPGSSQPAPPPSPAPSSSARGASPSGSAVAAADVPVGGGVVLTEADYVITQPTAGDFRAFSKFCTHKQCPLASVGGGTINCMCHGGRYSMLDGSVQAGPPPKPLPPAEVTVTGGWVVITG